MRRAFAEALHGLMERDEDIILIVGDIGYNVFDSIKRDFPNQYINIGCCEQSMIGVGAGLALAGMKPYLYSIISFVLERPYEQIKIDIALNQVNVKIIGFWDYEGQGDTHFTRNPRKLCEPLKINYREPKNGNETKQMINDAYKSREPYFFYLTKDI